ncbi:MAG: DUF1282 family protein [Gammaproteobacteria bacterium]|nr:DUF1282 family protein [Gammaproteobacteria bacterium]
MSILIDSLRLLFAPHKAWNHIGVTRPSLMAVMMLHTLPLALIPAVCWFYGVTQSGWVVAGTTLKLTTASALPVCVLFYLGMVWSVLFLGFMVHWMAKTYESETTLARGVTLISFSATPFFIAGVFGLKPVLWLDMLVGITVSCYCIYLLYVGTPVVMRVRPSRGFLYASAVFAVALVTFVALLGATVVLWDLGPALEYSY